MIVESINDKNVLKLELHANDQNRCLLCKFPDSHAVTRTTESSGNMVIQGRENAIHVKVIPEITANVYSNRALLNFCKKNIDCNIVDAALLSDSAAAEFGKIGCRCKDIGCKILICYFLWPCICLLAMVDPFFFDSYGKNIWKWKEKKMVASKEKGTFVDYKFVLMIESK